MTFTWWLNELLLNLIGCPFSPLFLLEVCRDGCNMPWSDLHMRFGTQHRAEHEAISESSYFRSNNRIDRFSYFMQRQVLVQSHHNLTEYRSIYSFPWVWNWQTPEVLSPVDCQCFGSLSYCESNLMVFERGLHLFRDKFVKLCLGSHPSCAPHRPLNQVQSVICLCPKEYIIVLC